MPQTILIAIDGSDQARYAFDWYLDNVHREGNIVYVGHCLETNMNIGFPGANPDIEKINEYVEKMKKVNAEREETTNTYMDILRSKKIQAKVSLLGGKPGEALVEAAKKESVDHVVVGTRGLGTLRRTMLGSVSEYLIHHCDCPVTVVRKK